jgi:outer membrane immunogenic protein
MVRAFLWHLDNDSRRDSKCGGPANWILYWHSCGQPSDRDRGCADPALKFSPRATFCTLTHTVANGGASGTSPDRPQTCTAAAAFANSSNRVFAATGMVKEKVYTSGLFSRRGARMKTFPLRAVALFGLGLSSAATAADLNVPPLKAPPVAPMVYNYWTGFYFGGNIGGVWAHASDTFINDVGIAERFSYDPVTALIGGGHLGAQRQFGNWVLGLEGTLSTTNLSQTDQSAVIGGGRTRSLKIDDIATVTGRVGYGWNNWLPYLKGGWADVRVNSSSIDPTGGSNSNNTKWNGGWTVGGGVDFMLVQNWIAGVDFTYYNVSYNNTFVFLPAGSTGTITSSQANIYAVTGRLTFLFNGSGPFMWTY